MKIRNKKTGEITTAVYAPHRGKRVYHVEIDGKLVPFPDKDFDKNYKIISQ